MSRHKGWLSAGAACLVLAGCADQPAGAAAVVGEERIELAQVTQQVRAINQVLGLAPDAPDGPMTNAVVRNNIVYQLVQQAADEAGVAVSQTTVDERMATQLEFVGSQSQLDQRAAQTGVAPDMIETDVRVSLLAEALATNLAGDQEMPEEEMLQLLIAEIQAFSVQAGTTSNPRFGVWSAEQLAVVSDPNAPSRPADLTQIDGP